MLTTAFRDALNATKPMFYNHRKMCSHQVRMLAEQNEGDLESHTIGMCTVDRMKNLDNG